MLFGRSLTRRLDNLLAAIRSVREGAYNRRAILSGHDEYTQVAGEFNALVDRLQETENARRQFVSDASHELKTPLAAIRLLTDSILQNEMDMETVREFVGDIGNEADRLNRMTAKLLALTKDESNTANDEAEIIYMSPTVERVVKMLSGIAAQTRIKITMDLEEDTPILIQEDDLYQITFNLVENGIKYNIPGGSLSISLHRQEEMMVLRVEDPGMGIPEESMSHIFERFYRVDKARSRQTGGSGLGLSIVRNMVERNNGEIHLESAIGKGTTFMVAFPCFDITDNLDNFYDEQLSEENQ
jgi:signal transduction histidine kinase